MLDNKIMIKEASESEATGIVQLFKENYKGGYYNENFLSDENLKALLSKKNEFIGIVALSDEKIVGFSGIYLQRLKNIKKVYLSNFLVDEKFRGLGIGNMMEQKKVAFYSALQGKTVIYSILSENSISSIKIKKTFGYDIWGVRLFYGEWEPNQIGTGHLVVVGRTNGLGDIRIKFPNVHSMTRKIIEETVASCSFLGKVNKRFTVIAEYPNSIQYGQSFCTVRYDEKGEDILKVIKKMKSTCDYPYIVIRVNTRGFTQAVDDLLIKNNFFPTSFLPCFDDGDDIIEYQYIRNNQFDLLSDYLANKNELVEYSMNL